MMVGLSKLNVEGQQTWYTFCTQINPTLNACTFVSFVVHRHPVLTFINLLSSRSILSYEKLYCKIIVHWHCCIDHVDREVFLRFLVLYVFLNLLIMTYSFVLDCRGWNRQGGGNFSRFS